MFTQTIRRIARRGIALGITIVALAISASVLAQPPAGGPQRGGAGGQRGGGMRGMRGGNRVMTAAMVPVPALAAELKLDAKQQGQIKTIQDKFRKEMMAMFSGGGGPGGPGGGGPRPPGPSAGGPRPGGGGGPGGPGGPGRMGGMSQPDVTKMQNLSTKATSSIDAVLTPAQKKLMPAVLKELGALRQSGVPLETIGDLKLTPAQKTKIVGITDKSQKDMDAKVKAAKGDFQTLGPAFQESRRVTHTSVMAVLTAPQKAVVDKYEKDHPRRGFGGGGPGGPGGPGGRPGGGGRMSPPKA